LKLRRKRIGSTISNYFGGQGCQIFLGTWYQTRKNVTNQHKISPWNFPNGHKRYQLFPIYVRHSKDYPNCDFWFKINHLATMPRPHECRQNNLNCTPCAECVSRGIFVMKSKSNL
jgi:hypothetical protein